MAVSTAQSRYILAVCIVFVITVGIVVASSVIPTVRVATAPNISPDSAVPAFWVGVGLHFFCALILAATTALTKERGRLYVASLAATGLLVLFLGFVLADAASAFGAAGMRSVATILYACVAADALAGALTIATVFLRPKSPMRA